MFNNAVFDSNRNLVGYRCHECQEIKGTMWGEICNECRDKERRHKELISAIQSQGKEKTRE